MKFWIAWPCRGHKRLAADLSPRNSGLEGQFHVEFVLNKMALRQVCLRARRFCCQYHFTYHQCSIVLHKNWQN